MVTHACDLRAGDIGLGTQHLGRQRLNGFADFQQPDTDGRRISARQIGRLAAGESGWHRWRPGYRPVVAAPDRSQCHQFRFDARANGGLEIARWYQIHLGAENGLQLSLDPS